MSFAEKRTYGSLVSLTTHLIETKRIKPDEIARLGAILDEVRGQWRRHMMDTVRTLAAFLKPLAAVARLRHGMAPLSQG